MSQIFQIPDTLTHSYPDLTVANHNELATLLERLQLTFIEHGYVLDSASDWPIITAQGNNHCVCSRNILTIGADKSTFYQQRWKHAQTLEQANIHLLDYYEKCKNITRLGVLLTDVWRPSVLSRWADVIEMYENQGIQSVALLYSGQQITPITWPWR